MTLEQRPKRPYGRQTRPISFRIPAELEEKLTAVVIEAGVDRSAWVEHAIRLRLHGDAEQWAKAYAHERRMRERAEEKLRRVRQALDDNRP